MKPPVMDNLQSATETTTATPGGAAAQQIPSGDGDIDVQMTPGISTSLPEKEPSIWTEVKRRHRTPTSQTNVQTGKVSDMYACYVLRQGFSNFFSWRPNCQHQNLMRPKTEKKVNVPKLVKGVSLLSFGVY